jgi:tyrosine-protein phosphatase SIW14
MDKSDIMQQDTDLEGVSGIPYMSPAEYETRRALDRDMEMKTKKGKAATDENTPPSDAMEGIELTSRPPTPPTRPDSPEKVACPARLHSRIPPRNFGAVTDHQIYRSGFPEARNLDFMRGLNIKTLLCFVETEPCVEYTTYISDNAITRKRIDIATNKEGNVNITTDSVCEALLTVLDVGNYPLHIHCNQGRHRTGCIIACMRKVQGWPISAILSEYETYANPKMRPGDIDFIANVFQPEMFLEYAKNDANFDYRPELKNQLRNDLLDLAGLLETLGSIDGLASSKTSMRTIESKADSGIDLADYDPQNLGLGKTTNWSITGNASEVDATEISVIECDPMSPPAESADSPFFSSLH